MTKRQLQEIENIIDSASSESLLISMNRALTFALSIENKELSDWIEYELSGYHEDNETWSNNKVVVPKYRKIIGVFVDDNGTTLQQYNKNLEQFNFWYIRDGIAELYSFIKENGKMTISEGNNSSFDDFTEKFNIPITKFIFYPSVINSVLQGIKSKLIKCFIEIRKENQVELGILSKKENLKYLQSLHNSVKITATPFFEDEHYRPAVLDTYIALIQAVKNKSNIFDKDGMPLMDFVFSPNNPILKISDDKDEQLGLMLLFKGAVMYIRNTNLHRIIEWNDPHKALEWLSFASSLFNTLDDCILT